MQEGLASQGKMSTEAPPPPWGNGVIGVSRQVHTQCSGLADPCPALLAWTLDAACSAACRPTCLMSTRQDTRTAIEATMSRPKGEQPADSVSDWTQRPTGSPGSRRNKRYRHMLAGCKVAACHLWSTAHVAAGWGAQIKRRLTKCSARQPFWSLAINQLLSDRLDPPHTPG